jgi:hypothetical protein
MVRKASLICGVLSSLLYVAMNVFVSRKVLAHLLPGIPNQLTSLEAVMIERASELLFVLSLVAPPVSVALGVLLVAWPHRLHGVTHTSRSASRA